MFNERGKYLLTIIATNIKQLRESKNISQFELSLRAGCSRTQISRIENCEVNPTILLLNEIALALDVAVVELLEER